MKLSVMYFKLKLHSKAPFMDHSLVMERALHNSMKLGTMPFMATQDEQVIVKSSDKCGPLEKEMATHFSILAMNPINSMKRQKDVTLEDEPHKSEGVQYAIGEDYYQ